MLNIRVDGCRTRERPKKIRIVFVRNGVYVIYVKEINNEMTANRVE